jgi:long-chain acyl-CoA synthetase
MNFLESIFARLQRAGGVTVLEEIHGSMRLEATGDQLMCLVVQARDYITAQGMRRGERCALLAPNSIQWVAADLALMAEGIIVVPLYSRHSTAEIARILQDSLPVRILTSEASLFEVISTEFPGVPPMSLLSDVFAMPPGKPPGERAYQPPIRLEPDSPVTIIYTSGTSGEPKGVVLNISNITFMLGCTNGRLDALMRDPRRESPERVFHYLPCNFAASWIVVLTCLSRNSRLSFSSEILRIADELQVVLPDYFLNVPTLLERMRTAIETQIASRGRVTARFFGRARRAFMRHETKEATALDRLCLAMARPLIFAKIRRQIGSQLKALISGSAPLSLDTQFFFVMLGIPVMQGYGLTETTGICTLDDPARYELGRVGPAIPGIEMRLGDEGEILVRGPNIFPGYWNRQDETARAIEGGWFHTGDLGDVNENGNWRITGRLKNLIILNSGHNIAPEPIEEELLRQLPGASQVILAGNDRSFLLAVITGPVGEATVRAAVDKLNAALPHYERVRASLLEPEPFSIESGLIAANGKLRREAILRHLAERIEAAYRAVKA